MQSKFIKIISINDIKSFVEQANKLPDEAWVTQGGTKVRASSLMGMFAIDTAAGFTVDYPREAPEFEAFLAQFEGSFIGSI